MPKTLQNKDIRHTPAIAIIQLIAPSRQGASEQGSVSPTPWGGGPSSFHHHRTKASHNSVNNLIDCITLSYPLANLHSNRVSHFGLFNVYIVNLH